MRRDQQRTRRDQRRERRIFHASLLYTTSTTRHDVDMMSASSSSSPPQIIIPIPIQLLYAVAGVIVIVEHNYLEPSHRIYQWEWGGTPNII